MTAADIQPNFSDSLRLLCVSPTEPSWIGITVQLGKERISEPHYRWASTVQEALTILRREIFDAILMVTDLEQQPEQLQPSIIHQFLDAMRTSGHDEPAVLVIDSLEDSLWTELCQLECDIIISHRSWNAPALVPSLIRSVRRNEIHRSKRHMETQTRKHEHRTHSETQQIIKHLESIIIDRQLFERTGEEPDSSLPENLQSLYAHLLRTFCMMGEGTLTTELAQLAEILNTANVTATDALKMHITQTRSLVEKLKSKSARHVLVRADLLIIELLVHLGDGFHAHLKA
ncbi:MAG: hypothetical protein HUJ26_24525 [Planctomycetaceae bacterium]|nr:hypothetical protein [Planctomycetaceae bacterium]